MTSLPRLWTPVGSSGPVNDIEVICINIVTPVIEMRYRITIFGQNFIPYYDCVIFSELLSKCLICHLIVSIIIS
jgi:hypothetical protein